MPDYGMHQDVGDYLPPASYVGSQKAALNLLSSLLPNHLSLFANFHFLANLTIMTSTHDLCNTLVYPAATTTSASVQTPLLQ